MVYGLLMILGQLHRLKVSETYWNPMAIIVMVCLALWAPVEYFRVQFGF